MDSLPLLCLEPNSDLVLLNQFVYNECKLRSLNWNLVQLQH